MVIIPKVFVFPLLLVKEVLNIKTTYSKSMAADLFLTSNLTFTVFGSNGISLPKLSYIFFII